MTVCNLVKCIKWKPAVLEVKKAQQAGQFFITIIISEADKNFR